MILKPGTRVEFLDAYEEKGRFGQILDYFSDCNLYLAEDCEGPRWAVIDKVRPIQGK